MIFYSIFNFDPTIVIMKASKLSLNPTDVSCRNGVETCHVKILNGQNTNTLYHITVKSFNRILYLSQSRTVNQRKALFYLKALLGNNFHQFDKCPCKNTDNALQVETKPVCK